MKVPKWCTGPVVYALTFAVATVVFYALYPVLWVVEKFTAARAAGGSTDA